ncbi:MAG: isoprenylcysteine carboxylmethyltransferase family protein [Acidobacteriota bacterium]
MSRSLGSLLARIRLTIGLGFILAFLVLAHPTAVSLLASGPLFLAGLFTRAWAAGHLVKRKTLTTAGPYAHTRNPLYFGSFLLLLGACVAAASILLAAIAIPVFVFVHLLVIREEEALIRGNFGEAFEAYRAAVPSFFPRARRGTTSEGSWSGAQYVKNGEYNATLGVIAAAAFLVLRILGRI